MAHSHAVSVVDESGHIAQLDHDTSASLASAQVIPSLELIVKELIDNAVDANAQSVEVRISKDSVCCRDDGVGIPAAHCALVAQRFTTTKLARFTDLSKLASLGFRGEGMHSIANLCSTVKITTCTRSEASARTFALNSNGEMVESSLQCVSSNVGTSVTAQGLFSNLPVRRQAHLNAYAKSLVKNTHNLVVAYALAFPALRFSLKVDDVPNPDYQLVKPSVTSLLLAAQHIFGVAHASRLSNEDVETEGIALRALLPARQTEPADIFKSNHDHVYVSINSRPVQYMKEPTLKRMLNLLRLRLLAFHDKEAAEFRGKVPFLCLHILVPSKDVDVNVEPDKSVVFLLAPLKILAAWKDLLDRVYPLDAMYSQTSNVMPAFTLTSSPHRTFVSKTDHEVIQSAVQTPMKPPSTTALPSTAKRLAVESPSPPAYIQKGVASLFPVISKQDHFDKLHLSALVRLRSRLAYSPKGLKSGLAQRRRKVTFSKIHLLAITHASSRGNDAIHGQEIVVARIGSRYLALSCDRLETIERRCASFLIDSNLQLEREAHVAQEDTLYFLAQFATKYPFLPLSQALQSNNAVPGVCLNDAESQESFT